MGYQPQQFYNGYYQQPYNQQYQRLAQLEQQQQMQQQQQMPFMAQQMANQTSSNYLKGRPVVSIEEARASQIDLDGSLFVFTDIGNKKIYTKQINLDGTASLNTYNLADDTPVAESYVTRSEFDDTLTMIKDYLAEINNNKVEERKQTYEQKQPKPTTTTIRQQPSI